MINPVLNELMAVAKGPADFESRIIMSNIEPVLPSRFAIADLAAGAQAACGIAAADLWELRTGHRQRVEVNARAAVASFQSFIYMKVETPPDPRQGGFGGFYPTCDGRWFYLHPNLPDTPARNNALAVLACEPNPASVGAAIAGWDAQYLEDTLADAGCCAAMARGADEWLSHPQGAALRKLPVIEILKMGNSDPEPFGPGNRPLSDTRVLDLTRILAGPTCGRTLAEHGADVLRIDGPHLQDSRDFVIDTGHGKRAAFLDLRREEDREKLKSLIRGTDVFSQGYRLGALAGRGFTPEAIAEIRPGIIYVSINCYGHEGPWKQRRGWEQLAQTVTGIAIEEGSDKKPRLLPSIAATDYGTGYMAAFGAMIALGRRAREGGSYLVRASLCQTGMLLNRLHRTAEADVTALKQKLSSDDYKQLWAKTDLPAAQSMRMTPYLLPEEFQQYSAEVETPYGLMRRLSPIVRLSETPPHWRRPSVPRGYDNPVWLD